MTEITSEQQQQQHFLLHQKDNQASFLHIPQSTGSYEFHIRDFELLPHNINQKYSSSSFSICGEDKWDLIIIPGGVDNDVSKLVTIGLRNLYSKEIRTSCSLFISAGTSGLKFVASTDPGQLYSAYGNDGDTWYTPLPFTFNETLKPGFEFLVNGEMVIVAKLNICGDPKFLSSLDTFNDHSISTLSDDLDYLLNQSSSSSNCLKGDITLISGDVRVTCHQCILACRSRVFRESFHTTASAMKLMINSGKNVGNKIHPSILREFVRFLYTDECRMEFLIGEQLIYMFNAACKYQVFGLMSICEKRMTETITISNAAYYLSVADAVGVKSLIQSCLKFIANHTSEVVGTEGYLQLDSHLCRLILGEVTLGSSSTASGEIINDNSLQKSTESHVKFSKSEDIVELGSVSRESKLHDEPISQMSSISEDTHEF